MLLLMADAAATAAAVANANDGDATQYDVGTGAVDQGDVAAIQKDMQTGYQHYANAWYYLPEVDLPELGDAHMRALQALTSHLFLDAQERSTLDTTKAYVQDLRLRGEGAQAWVVSVGRGEPPFLPRICSRTLMEWATDAIHQRPLGVAACDLLFMLTCAASMTSSRPKASMITGILEPAEQAAHVEVDKHDALLKEERKALITARIVDEFGSCDPVEDAKPVRTQTTRPGRALSSALLVQSRDAGSGGGGGGGGGGDATAEESRIQQLKQQLARDRAQMVHNPSMDPKVRTQIAAKIKETEKKIVAAQTQAAAAPSGGGGAAVGPEFRHIDMNGRRFPYSAADNDRIAAAFTAGDDFVQLDNVTLPDGKTAQFGVKFGASATAANFPKPAATGMLQVNLNTDWGRVVERGGVASNDSPADVAGSDNRAVETPASDAAIVGVKNRFIDVFEKLKKSEDRADSAVYRQTLEDEVAVLKAQLVAAESEKKREAKKAREGALQLEALLNGERDRAADARKQLLHNSAAATTAAAAQTASDATAIMIQQQERAAGEADRLKQERALQQARVKARLSQRNAARKLAAAQLNTLKTEIALLPTLQDDASEEEHAKAAVATEGILQRWNTLSEQTALLRAASAKADANLDNVSAGIVAEAQMNEQRVEHLKRQLALDQAQLAQNGSLDPKLKSKLAMQINAQESELAAHAEGEGNGGAARWAAAVESTQLELKDALVEERSAQNMLLMKLGARDTTNVWSPPRALQCARGRWWDAPHRPVPP